MNLNEAFKKSVISYFNDDPLEETNSTLDEEFKYTKSYFDLLEEELGLSSKKAKDEKELKEKK